MGAGHIVDEHTLCHWTFDEALADITGESIVSIDGTAPLTSVQTGSGFGFTDFSPVPGLYSRKCFATNTKPDEGGAAMSRATSTASQNHWKASWSVEMYLRLDKLPTSTNLDAIFGFLGSATSNTEAENHLGSICVNSSGKLVILWQYGASGTQETLTQVNGSGPPVSNPQNSGA